MSATLLKVSSVRELRRWLPLSRECVCAYDERTSGRQSGVRCTQRSLPSLLTRSLRDSISAEP